MTANLICDSYPKWIHFASFLRIFVAEMAESDSQTMTRRINSINNQFEVSKVNSWAKIASWQISWCERHKFEFHLNWCNSKIRWNEPIFRHLGGKFPTIGCFCYWEVLLYPQQLKYNSQMNQFTASLCESFTEPISTRIFLSRDIFCTLFNSISPTVHYTSKLLHQPVWNSLRNSMASFLPKIKYANKRNLIWKTNRTLTFSCIGMKAF